MLIDGKDQRAYSHIYLMEHVTHTKTDELIQDLREPGAFLEQNIQELASKHSAGVCNEVVSTVATQMKIHRAKKDAEAGLVMP